MSSDEERKDDRVEKLEKFNDDRVDDAYDPDAGLSDEERKAVDKKLVRRLDWILIPWLSLLYLASFLDRTNIGNAKIDGLPDDLRLTSGQYNAAVSLFFVSYAGFEPLTNVLLKRLRPSIFLPLIMVLWGVVMTLTGLVQNFSGLAAARFFLGMAEAGLFPGINYYLSCWYKRSELGVRAAIFFSAAAISGSFGGLLAAALAQIKCCGWQEESWRWIFIVEGIATVVIAIASFWLVFDFPQTAKILNEDDRVRVLRRLNEDGHGSSEDEAFKMAYFWAAVKDWKTWAFAIVYMGCDGALYAFALFLPSIISELGYKSTEANLLSVPPYAVAAVLTVFIGWLADRTKQRGWCNIGISFLGIIGYCMLIGSTNPHVKYAGTFLGACGVYPCIANTITWAANCCEGVYKRGVMLGIVIGWGNLNGVMSSNVYLSWDAPNYRIGHGVVLAYLVLFLLGGSIVTHFMLEAENKKRRDGKRDHLAAGKTSSEVAMMGDMRPDFVYTT